MNPPESRSPDATTFAAVLFFSRQSAATFNDRLSGARRLSGAGFDTVTGWLGEQRIVTVTSHTAEVNSSRLLTALLAAHRPSLVIGAGFATATTDTLPPSTPMIANRVVGPKGEALTLANVEPAAGVTIGTLAQRSEETGGDPNNGVIALNDWCHDFALACAERAIATALCVVVESQKTGPKTSDVTHVLQQRSLAGQAGAALGAVWRRPQAAVELWRNQTKQWERQAALADLVAWAIGSSK